MKVKYFGVAETHLDFRLPLQLLVLRNLHINYCVQYNGDVQELLVDYGDEYWASFLKSHRAAKQRRCASLFCLQFLLLKNLTRLLPVQHHRSILWS